MSRTKNYGVDLDGIVFDWSASFVDYIHKLYKIDIDLRSVRHWDWSDSGVMTKQQFNTAFRKFTKNRQYRFLSPIVSARKGLNILKEIGHKIHFITSRPDGTEEDTVCSLKSADIQYDTVTITNKKGRAAKKLAIDAFIDDKIDNCKEVQKVGVKRIYLYSKLYNHNFPVDENGFRRVSNWQEFIEAEGMKWV